MRLNDPDALSVHISQALRIPWAYSKKKKKRREGKARGDKGELSWENGGTDAARRHLVSRRENRLSLFLHPCILLASSSVRFVNRENLYFLRE